MNKIIENNSHRFKVGDYVVAVYSLPYGIVYGKVVRVEPGSIGESQILYILELNVITEPELVIMGHYCHLLTPELVEEMKKNEIDKLNTKWDRIKNMIENS